MAQFKDYFGDAERLLLWLSQVEVEANIGNSASGEWGHLFVLCLSHKTRRFDTFSTPYQAGRAQRYFVLVRISLFFDTTPPAQSTLPAPAHDSCSARAAHSQHV
jgi:hypothetical protein